MAKRVQSEAQKDFQKERRRLLQAVRRGQQKGYIFPEDVVPPLPKHVTHKQLEDIKATRPTDLYQVAKIVDFATGEILDSSQQRVSQRTEEPKPSKRKIAKVDSRVKHPRLSTPKEQLTEEEKHRRAVERGRKAWATRRAKMTDEEYRDYVETFKRRMQSARQRKVQEDYPTITAIDTVHERLEELDRVYSPIVNDFSNELVGLKREVPPWYPIEKRKGTLISIFDDTIAMYEENLGELEEYLLSNMSVIEEHLNVIRYDSKEEHLENSFIELGILLNRSSLSPSQAEGLSHMAEYYNSYEEY